MIRILKLLPILSFGLEIFTNDPILDELGFSRKPACYGDKQDILELKLLSLSHTFSLLSKALTNIPREKE